MATVEEALAGVSILALDSAPVIYFVENVPEFYPRCTPFFRAIQEGGVVAFTSTLTLTKVLSHPYRAADAQRAEAFRNLLTGAQGLDLVAVSEAIADRAAILRADYNLRTPDAIQAATALLVGCHAFLTNDAGLRRVAELNVVVVGELDEPADSADDE